MQINKKRWLKNMIILLGKEPVNYVSKKTLKQVIGTSIHLQFEKEGVEGSAVASEFTRLDVSKIPIGSIISLIYERQPGSNYSTLTKIDIVQ